MFKTISAISIALILTGCSMSAEIDDSSRNKLHKCTDFRDGEVFFFNTNTVTDVRIGLGSDSTYDIVDKNGVKRTLSTGMEAYMKCKEVPLDTPTKTIS